MGSLHVQVARRAEHSPARLFDNGEGVLDPGFFGLERLSDKSVHGGQRGKPGRHPPPDLRVRPGF